MEPDNLKSKLFPVVAPLKDFPDYAERTLLLRQQIFDTMGIPPHVLKASSIASHFPSHERKSFGHRIIEIVIRSKPENDGHPAPES